MVHVVAVRRMGELDGHRRIPRVAPARAHLDRVIARGDHAVRARQRRHQDRVRFRAEPVPAKAERVVLRDHALGLVGGCDRHAVAFREGRERARPLRLLEQVEPGDDHRALGGREAGTRGLERRSRGRGGGQGRPAPRGAGLGLRGGGEGDRQIEMHGPLARLGRDRERLVDRRRDPARFGAQAGLGHAREDRAVVEHLVGVGELLDRVDHPREHDQRHAVLLGIDDDVEGVGKPRADRGDQHARRAGGMPDTLRHEAGGVLVLGEVKADAGALQRVDEAQHLAARDAEGMAHARSVQAGGDQVRGGHGALLPGLAIACSAAPAPPVPGRRRSRHDRSDAGRDGACGVAPALQR